MGPSDDKIVLRARDLSLLCFLVLISDLSFSGLTALVVDYERILHFDLTAVGWVASAEGAGYTLGAFLALYWTGRMSMTRLQVAGIFAILAVAQFLSLGSTNPWALAAARSVSGTSAGLAYAAGILTISGSENSERGFAVYFGANFASGLLALVIIPPIIAFGGLRGFYLCYGLALLASIGLVPLFPLPRARRNPGWIPANVVTLRMPRGTWSLVISMFLNFIFNGGIWVLAEHFGLEIPGTSIESLSPLLAATMIFGLIGTVLTTWVARRWTHLTYIFLGSTGLVASVFVLMGWHSIAALIIAMALLNISVTCFTPAALAALSNKGARGAQWGNLASQTGYSAGPAIVAGISARSGLNGLVWISAAAFVLSAVLAWIGIRAKDPIQGQLGVN